MIFVLLTAAVQVCAEVDWTLYGAGECDVIVSSHRLRHRFHVFFVFCIFLFFLFPCENDVNLRRGRPPTRRFEAQVLCGPGDGRSERRLRQRYGGVVARLDFPRFFFMGCFASRFARSADGARPRVLRSGRRRFAAVHVPQQL